MRAVGALPENAVNTSSKSVSFLSGTCTLLSKLLHSYAKSAITDAAVPTQNSSFPQKNRSRRSGAEEVSPMACVRMCVYGDVGDFKTGNPEADDVVCLFTRARVRCGCL